MSVFEVFEAVTFGVTLYQQRETPPAEDSLYCTSLWLRRTGQAPQAPTAFIGSRAIRIPAGGRW